jgi:hypothetical protein
MLRVKNSGHTILHVAIAAFAATSPATAALTACQTSVNPSNGFIEQQVDMSDKPVRRIDTLISHYQQTGPILPQAPRAQQGKPLRKPLQTPSNALPSRNNPLPPQLTAPVVLATARAPIQPLAANPGLVGVTLPTRQDPKANGERSARDHSVGITRPYTPSPPTGKDHLVSKRSDPTPYSEMPSAARAPEIANRLPIAASHTPVRPEISLVPSGAPDGKQKWGKQDAEGDRKPAASNYGSIPTAANTQEPARKTPPKSNYGPIPTGPKPLSSAPTKGNHPTVSGVTFIPHGAQELKFTEIPQRPRNGVAMPSTKPPRPEPRPPLQSNGTVNQK